MVRKIFISNVKGNDNSLFRIHNIMRSMSSDNVNNAIFAHTGKI